MTDKTMPREMPKRLWAFDEEPNGKSVNTRCWVTYKPTALPATNRAEYIRADIAEAKNQALIEALEEIYGCFQAAYAEGLLEELSNQENKDTGSLYDLVIRRLMPALEIADTRLNTINKVLEG